MTKRKLPARKPARPRARKTLSVYLGGESTKVAIAEIRLRGGRPLAFTPEMVKLATSPWWFWTLELPLAEALGQALIDVGGAEGFKTGAELVAFLRKKYS